MKEFFTFVIIIIFAIPVGAQEIKLGIVEANSSEPIPFATIVVEYEDNITGGMADTDGIFSFVTRSLPLSLKVSGFGMKENSISISTIHQ